MLMLDIIINQEINLVKISATIIRGLNAKNYSRFK